MKYLIAAALGIFVACNSNAANVNTNALDDVIRSYPQHRFGNVLAFQYTYNKTQMIGVLKNGNWTEQQPLNKNVVQISINDVLYAANKLYNCKDIYNLMNYANILKENNSNDMTLKGYGILNKGGYDAFIRLCGTYNNLRKGREETFFDILNLPSLPTNVAVRNSINDISTNLKLPIQYVYDACRWWMYAMHTEAQFDVLKTVVLKGNFFTNIKQQALQLVMTSKYEPCKSCRQLGIVQRCKQFRFHAIDADAGFSAQCNLNTVCLWNDFSKILSADMAKNVCDLYKKKRQNRHTHKALLNSFESLIKQLSYNIGYEITVSNDQYN